MKTLKQKQSLAAKKGRKSKAKLKPAKSERRKVKSVLQARKDEVALDKAMRIPTVREEMARREA